MREHALDLATLSFLQSKSDNHNVELIDLIKMWKDQAGHCVLCKSHFGFDLHLDHDHDTGKVRGFLCQRCNTALGKVEMMIKQSGIDHVLEYLERGR